MIYTLPKGILLLGKKMEKENQTIQPRECTTGERGTGNGERTAKPSTYFSKYDVLSTTYKEQGTWCLADKGFGKRITALLTAIVFVWSMCITPVMAETIKVEGGSIDVDVKDKTTNWNVTGNPVWNVPEFNVPQGNIYNIAGLNQNASLALLVNGGKASNIFGTMNLNNLDFILQNIAGINIGSTGLINLNNASLIASTMPLNLSLTNFLSHQYSFEGNTGFLMNEGRIVGNKGDLVALVANAIENKGTIEVPMGTVALAAGNTVTVGISGDGMVSIGVDEATANKMGLKDQIKNSGSITADGGKVILDAKAVSGLFEKAINIQRSEKSITAIKADNGTIEFQSMDDIYNNAIIQAMNGQIKITTERGTVTNAGTMDATKGSIDLSAAGAVETKGVLKAGNVTERGASFKMGGRIEVGHMDMDNLDNRADIAANAQLSGNFTDQDDISVLGNFSLIGNTTIQTDSDLVNDDGTLSWAAAYLLTGNGHDLTLKVSKDSIVGAISGVNLLTFDKNTGKTPTYTGSTSDDISVNTIKTTYGTTFSKDVTVSGNHMIYSDSNAPGGLQYMNQNLGYNYKMANNIDASETSSWNAGAGFDPVGNSASGTEFSGNFNGNFHTIAGLTINRSTEDNVGLFGYARNESGFTIQNVGLVGASVTGKDNTGALVGVNYYATITNAYSASGAVTGHSQTGGLVGSNALSHIANSYAMGIITGSWSDTGGLVGSNGGGSSIDNSFATGTVNGAVTTGGLAGTNSTSSSISNSYFSGAVNGANSTGGLVGVQINSCSISNSYATGTVTATDLFHNGQVNTGGLVGDTQGSTISNSYSTSTVTGGSWVGGFLGYYWSGTMTNNWWFNGMSLGVGSGNLSGITQAVAASDFNGTGSGTGGRVYYQDDSWTTSAWNFTEGAGFWNSFADKNPHLDYEWSQSITTLLQLQNMSLNLSASYTLANNIDASATSTWNGDLGFTPVGNGSAHFNGNFDGNGKTITGLTINRNGMNSEEYIEDYVGLFGYSTGAIQNVGLVGGSISGHDYVGGVAGYNSGTISSSYDAGTVISLDYVGGITGWNSGTVSNSYAAGIIGCGLRDEGGIVGHNTGTVSNSYNSGTIYGAAMNVGGVVGLNSGTVSNSYNTGAVDGYQYIGGVVGTNWGGAVSNCGWYDARGAASYGIAADSWFDPQEVTYEKVDYKNFYNPGYGVYDQGGANPWDFDADGISAGHNGTWIIAGLPHLQMEWTPTITNAAQLQMMALNLSANYTIANGIDARETVNWNNGAGFVPVGNDSGAFTGSFDGNSNTISHLYVNDASLTYAGLFGYANLGTNQIKNLSLTIDKAVGSTFAGGLAGAVEGGTITGCDVTVNSGGLVSAANATGGLVGEIFGGNTLSNSHAVINGTVEGMGDSVDAAGLVGWVPGSATITNSYAIINAGGTVTGPLHTGGLVGHNDAGQISNCYTTINGTLSGDSFVGGLVGYNPQGGITGITDSYSHKIYNVLDLQLMQYDLSGSFTLMKNIDASETATWNYDSGSDTYLGFDPVGTFSGSFNGQNHTINDLLINRPSTDSNGLFGITSHATIDNVGLVNVSISGGYNDAGGLVGTNNFSPISNSYSTGSVSGRGNCVGGLVGANYSSPISNSYSTGTVSGGGQYAGGLVGFNGLQVISYPPSSITNSYSIATVSGSWAVGGLVGSNDYFSSISNSYSTGSVRGSVYGGGLVGLNQYSSVITNSFATGLVNGTSGVLTGGDSGINSFYSTNKADFYTGGYYAGGAGGNVYDPSGTYGTAWDFTVDGTHAGSGTWIMAGLPHLQMEWSNTITNVAQLQMMSLNLGASYTLASNIDASDTVNWNGGLGFDPVGNLGSGNKFTGNFDGNSHTVVGLTINRPAEWYVGLFGFKEGGILSNIGLSNVNVKGLGDVGALVGYSSYSHITNSHSSGTVTGSDAFYGIGGLVGFADTSAIDNTYSSGNVIGASGGNGIGGLVGVNFEGNDFSNSYSSADVTSGSGSSRIGGLIGMNCSTDIDNSFASGNVTGGSGSTIIGGLVGEDSGFYYNNTWYVSTNQGVGNRADVAGHVTKETGGATAFYNLGHAVYSGWDFTVTGNGAGSGTWIMAGLPHLQNEWTTNITNVALLQMMALNLGSNYTLANNIVADGSSLAHPDWNTSLWNGGLGFNPVGSSGGYFHATFNGQGHTVSGLTINRPDAYNVGLFGFTFGETIENLGLSNVNITGLDNVGGIVGSNFLAMGTVKNSFVTGNVTGRDYVGGLIGDNYSSAIRNTYTAVHVSGRNYVGGLAGVNGGTSVITNSYATGNVDATGDNVGGLVGLNNNSSITDAYATGTVTGNDFTGGLVGENTFSTITNSYSTGAVTGNNSTGGLVGRVEHANGESADTYIINSGWYDNAGDSASDAIGKTGYFDYGIMDWVSGGPASVTYKESNASAFSSPGHPVYDPYNTGGNRWNFNEGGNASATWVPVVDNSAKTAGLPILGWQSGAVHMQGDGSAETPYQVTNVGQLQVMAYDLLSNYELMNNINADVAGYNTGLGFLPVGGWGLGTFQATFNGQGHTISNLMINRPDTDDVGLFGFTYNETIENLGLINANIIGRDSVGGIVGSNFCAPTTVKNSYVTGNITGRDYVGGLVGYNYSSTIRNTYSTAHVSGRDYVGGLVGANDNSLITNSYSSGDVSVTGTETGGLVGLNLYSGSISNSFATGSVSGAGIMGGLVGQLDSGTLLNNWYILNGATQGVGNTADVSGQVDLQTGATVAEAKTAFYSSSHQVYQNSAAPEDPSNAWDFTPNTGAWESFASVLPHLKYENFTLPGITISGDVYNLFGGSVISDMANVVLLVMGVQKGTVSTTDGHYSFSNIVVSANDAILVYLKGYSAVGNTLTIAKDSTTTISNLHIYGNTLMLKTEITSPATPTITNTDLAHAIQGISDSGVLANIAYSIPSSVLNVTKNLLIPTSMTFAPDADVTANAGVNVASNAALDGSGHVLNIRGANASGYSLNNAGTVSGAIQFTGSGGYVTSNYINNTVTFGDGTTSGTWTVTGNAGLGYGLGASGITVNPNASLSISSALYLGSSGTLNNLGYVTGNLTPGGMPTLTGNGTWGDVSLYDIWQLGHAFNASSLSVSGGSSEFNLDTAGYAVTITNTLNNGGKIISSSGDLGIIAQSINSTGTFSTASGNINLNSTETPGAFYLGTLSSAGATNIGNVKSPASVSFGGAISASSGTNITMDGGNVSFGGAPIGSTVTFLGSGSLTTNGDAFSMLNIESGASYELTDPLKVNFTLSFSGNGTLTASATDLDITASAISGGGILTTTNSHNIILNSTEFPGEFMLGSMNSAGAITVGGTKAPSSINLTNSVTSTGAQSYNGATTLNGDINAGGGFTIAGGTFDSGSHTLNVGGNWDSSTGTFTYGTSTVNLTGTGSFKTAAVDQWDSSVRFYNISMAANGKTTTLLSTVDAKNILTLGTGNLTGTAVNLEILKPSGTSGLVNYGAHINLDSLSRIIYSPDSEGATVHVAGGDYGTIGSLQFDPWVKDVTFLFDGDIAVNGILNITSNTNTTYETQNHAVTANGIQFGEDMVRSSTFNAGNSIIDIGTGGLSVKSNGGLHNLNLQNATVTNAGDWTMVNGAGAITVDPGTSSVTLSGTGKAITSNSNSFHDLAVTGSYTLSDALSTTGSLDINGGSLDTTTSNHQIDTIGDLTIRGSGSLNGRGSVINVGGNWDSSAGTFTYGTSAVNLTGTGNIKTDAADNDRNSRFYDLSLAGNGKTTTVLSAIGVANDLTLGTGTLTGTKRVALNKSGGTTPFINNGATISLDRIIYSPQAGGISTVAGGNYGTLNSLELYAPASNVTYNLTGDITVNGLFWIAAYTSTTGVALNTQDHAITATGMQLGAVDRPGPTTVNLGNSVVNLGTGGVLVDLDGGTHNLNLGSAVITNAGNWIMKNGTGTITVDPGTSTVTMDAGTSGHAITSNGQAFHDLVFDSSNASGAWTLSDDLTADSIHVVDGNLTDAGKTVTVYGNIIVDSNLDILTSTGTWVQASNGNISNPLLYNISPTYGWDNQFNVLQINSGVTSTKTGDVLAQKAVLGAGAIMSGTGNALILHQTSARNDPLDMAAGSDVLGEVTIYSKYDFSQKAISISGGFDLIGAQNSGNTVTMTGDWTVNRLRIYGDGHYDAPGSYIRTLDTNSYKLTVNNDIVLGDYDSSSHQMFEGRVLFENGTHTISNNVRVATGGHGYFDLGTNSHITIGGNVDFTDATVTKGTSTVTMTGAAKTIKSSGNSFQNLTVQGSETLSDALNVADTLDIYGGSLDLSASNYAANVTGNLTIDNSGVLNGRGSTITVGDNWDSSSGSFNYGTSTLDLTGTGTLKVLTSSPGNFYNLTGAAAGKVTTVIGSDGPWVNNLLTLGTGTLSSTGGTVYLTKNDGDPLAGGPATISAPIMYIPRLGTDILVAGHTFVGAVYYAPQGNNTITLTSDVTAVSLSVWGGGNPNYLGVLNTNGHNLNISGNVTLGSSDIDRHGKIDFSTGTHSIGGNISHQSTPSTPTASSQIDFGSSNVSVGGNIDFTNIAVTKGTSTVTMNAGTIGHTITSAGQAFHNLVFDSTNASSAWTLSDDMTADSIHIVDGNLADAGKNVTVYGNMLIDNLAGILTSTGTWIQAASGNISNPHYHNSFGNLSIAGSGITTTMTGQVDVGYTAGSTGHLTLGSGTLNGGTNSLVQYARENNALSIASDPVTKTSLLKMGTPIWSFIYSPLGDNYSQSEFILPDGFTSNAFFIRPSGDHYITATGDFKLGTNTLEVMNDTIGGAGYFDMGANNLICGNLKIGGNSGLYASLGGYLKLGSGQNNMVIGDITMGDAANVGNQLDLGSSNLSVGGNIDFTNIAVTKGTSTVTMTGTGKAIKSNGNSFQNLTIQKSETLSDALNVAGNLDIHGGSLDLSTSNYGANVTGNLTIDNSGTLNGRGSAISVGGDWDFSAGTFSYNSGNTVTMTAANGDVTIKTPAAGVYTDQRFYNLVIDSAASHKVTFSSGVSGRPSNSLTLNSELDIGSGREFFVGPLATFTMNAGSKLSGGGIFDRDLYDTTPAFANNGTIDVALFQYGILGASCPITATNYGGSLTVLLQSGTDSTAVLGAGALSVGNVLMLRSPAAGHKVILDNTVNNTSITAGSLVIGVSGDTTKNAVLKTGSGTVNVNGDVNVYAGSGSNQLQIGSSNWTVGGNWTNSDTVTPGTSTVMLTGTGKQIAGTDSSFANLTVNGTYTNNLTGTLTVGTALAGSGTLTQGSNATLALGGTTTVSNLVATSTGNTVDYNAAGAQTVKGTSYYNLTVSGSDTKTVNMATTTISNRGTISGAAQVSLIVNATGVNKTYDGTDAATVNLSIGSNIFSPWYTVTGGTYTATFDAGKNVGAGKSISVNGISLGGVDAAKFTSNATAFTIADITARPITVTTDAGQSKVYGSSDPTFTYQHTALVGSDSLSGALGRTAGEAVAGGPYAINQGSLNAGSNYSLSFTGSNFTITPKALTITASDQTKAYGNSNLGTTAFTSTGLKNGETVGAVTLSTNATTSTSGNYNAGTWTITANNAAGGTFDINNYSVNYVTGALTIDQKAITLSGITASNKQYDQTTIATVSAAGATFNGMIAGDNLTVTSSNGTFSDKNVANGKTVTLTNVLGGADLGNYTITDQGTTTANITAKAVTLSGIIASNKTYDTTTGATVSKVGATFTGMIAGDNLTVISSTGTFGDKNVGANKTVTLTNVLGGSDLGNYQVTDQGTTTADITAATLTVTGVTAANKTYDGTTTAVLNTGSALLSGVLGSDNVTVNSSSTGTFSNKNVGVGKSITAGLTLSGTDASNYTIVQPSSLNANITARALRITATGVNKYYDGLTTATVTLTDDRVANDTLTTSYTSASFADELLGTAKPVSVSGISFSGTDAANYTLANTTALTVADITTAPVTIVTPPVTVVDPPPIVIPPPPVVITPPPVVIIEPPPVENIPVPINWPVTPITPPDPVVTPVTPNPIVNPVTPDPIVNPVTPNPVVTPVTPTPTTTPVTPAPTTTLATPTPTTAPTTPNSETSPVTSSSTTGSTTPAHSSNTSTSDTTGTATTDQSGTSSTQKESGTSTSNGEKNQQTSEKEEKSEVKQTTEREATSGSSAKQNQPAWHDVPIWNSFGSEESKKFMTDVRVVEGAVYVIDGYNTMNLLGVGDSMRVLYKKRKPLNARRSTINAEKKATAEAQALKSPVPAETALDKAIAAVSGSKPEVSSLKSSAVSSGTEVKEALEKILKKAAVEHEVAPAPEARVLKAAVPVVMRETKSGLRYGTLKNPGKDVFVRTPGGDWKSAKDGMILLPGDEVKTAERNSVEVLLGGGKIGRVEIKEGSLFRIQKSEMDSMTDDQTTILDLALGKILVKVESLKRNSKFEVRTPTALTGVRGTIFEVTVKEKA